jgi:DNA-binding XRE family transcriptional regulator
VVTNGAGINLFYSMAKSKKKPQKLTNAESYSDELKQLGNRIKSLRVEAGYTNYENFAFEHDIPRAQFGRYERGEDLRYTSLLKICEALDISVKEFFNEGFE